MKTTAVSWLIEQLKGKSQSITWNEIFNKAKEMEKQQIVDAYLKNRPKATINKALATWDKAEQYYNETYKK